MNKNLIEKAKKLVDETEKGIKELESLGVPEFRPLILMTRQEIKEARENIEKGKNLRGIIDRMNEILDEL